MEAIAKVDATSIAVHAYAPIIYVKQGVPSGITLLLMRKVVGCHNQRLNRIMHCEL